MTPPRLGFSEKSPPAVLTNAATGALLRTNPGRFWPRQPIVVNNFTIFRHRSANLPVNQPARRAAATTKRLVRIRIAQPVGAVDRHQELTRIVDQDISKGIVNRVGIGVNPLAVPVVGVVNEPDERIEVVLGDTSGRRVSRGRIPQALAVATARYTAHQGNDLIGDRLLVLLIKVREIRNIIPDDELE
jgi:hypothetical protein